MHKFAKHLTKEEIWDAIIFAILAFVILPILPTHPLDPFGALNPYIIWSAIVLVLSVNFIGYVLMKIFGAKYGLELTGLFSGLVSSTALTIDVTEKTKKNPKINFIVMLLVWS